LIKCSTSSLKFPGIFYIPPVSISIPAFLFCLGFAVFLGCLFAWVYNYRNLHAEPKGKPQRVTDTLGSPVDFVHETTQDGSAIKRQEQEKTCYEAGVVNKDAFVKKLLALFRSYLEQDNRKILSVCYWAFKGDGFTLRISNSPYQISDGLFIQKNDRYFSKKDFNWNGVDVFPIDIYRTEELVANSMAGAVVSGGGKLHGYITIDSVDPRAFDEEVSMELRELATLTEEVLRTLDSNERLDKQYTLLNTILKEIMDLFDSSSKGNLLANLSKILQDSFLFDRMMVITPIDLDLDKWQISEVVGEQKEFLKGEHFEAHPKSLLYEILLGKVSVINEKEISTDPYQRRLSESEPKNLGLRSLFAVRPSMRNNSYPLIIVLESKEAKAVSMIDEMMLTSLVTCAALKLSDILGKEDNRQEKDNTMAEVNANGFGEIMCYYEKEIDKVKNGSDGLGILFLKCIPSEKESKALVYEKFLSTVKHLKKHWNGKHLAMMGNGEFILSMTGSVQQEHIFDLFSGQLITIAKDMFGSEDAMTIKSHSIWLNKERLNQLEEDTKQSGKTLFLVSLATKFQEMAEASE